MKSGKGWKIFLIKIYILVSEYTIWHPFRVLTVIQTSCYFTLKEKYQGIDPVFVNVA